MRLNILSHYKVFEFAKKQFYVLMNFTFVHISGNIRTVYLQACGCLNKLKKGIILIKKNFFSINRLENIGLNIFPCGVFGQGQIFTFKKILNHLFLRAGE